LQTDGYVAYDGVGGPKIVHACCWAHYLDNGVIWRPYADTLCRRPLIADRSR
jgi:hypothetical protein